MTDLTERLRANASREAVDALHQITNLSETEIAQEPRFVLEMAQDALTTLETLTQENARLREAGWRDIESAPKDGARFIGLAKDGRATTMSYRSHVRGWKQSENGGWVADGYHLVLCEEDSTSICPRDALHWMPLPPAPARKALGGG